MMLAFDDGTRATFPKYNTFCTDLAGLNGTSFKNRICGHQGTPNIFTNGLGQDHGFEFRLNGGETTLEMLPMGLCVLHIHNPNGFKVAAFGSSNNNAPDRGFRGVVTDTLAFVQSPPDEVMAQVTLTLMQEGGIAA